MNKIQISEGLSLIDLCIRQYNTLEALFVFASDNDLSLDQDLEPGQELKITKYEFTKELTGFSEIPKPFGTNLTFTSDGQSLIDIVLQEAGSIEALFDVAKFNRLGVSDLLEPGQLLKVAPEAVLRADLVNYYKSRKLRINTGSNYVSPEQPEPDRIFDFTFGFTFN